VFISPALCNVFPPPPYGAAFASRLISVNPATAEADHPFPSRGENSTTLCSSFLPVFSFPYGCPCAEVIFPLPFHFNPLSAFARTLKIDFGTYFDILIWTTPTFPSLFLSRDRPGRWYAPPLRMVFSGLDSLPPVLSDNSSPRGFFQLLFSLFDLEFSFHKVCFFSDVTFLHKQPTLPPKSQLGFHLHYKHMFSNGKLPAWCFGVFSGPIIFSLLHTWSGREAPFLVLVAAPYQRQRTPQHSSPTPSPII